MNLRLKTHRSVHFIAISVITTRRHCIPDGSIHGQGSQKRSIEIPNHERPITAELVDSILSRKLDDLEPTLTRHGYRLKDMVEQFDAKPEEIRALFSHQLDPTRTAELRDRILAAGLPI
jgi:hypothetical protein